MRPLYFSNFYRFFIPVVLAFSLLSCEEKMTEDEIAAIGVVPCGKKPASFITSIGFNGYRSAYSTETDKYVGIILLEAPASATDSIKKYQDSSWSKVGYMGSITTDEEGNAYSYPIPFINTLNQSVETLNSVYKIDAVTGKMNLFTTLPKHDSVDNMVAFGLMGIYYDCHGKKIYAASVNGSTREKEDGRIYVLEKSNGEVVDQLKGIDAVGLCVGGVTGEKKLFFGKARTPEIYSVKLNKQGEITGNPSLELSLDQLGPRGDDRARRIRFNQQGELVIHGIEFNFSLAGQSDKPETVYRFGYNYDQKKWILIDFH